MLALFSFHGLFDLDIKAVGDIKKIDIHHTNEDIGIVLGQAFKKALGDKNSIKRFGASSVPMEEVVAAVSVDISGRGYFKLTTDKPIKRNKEESYSLADFEHFCDSLAKNMGINLNIRIDPTCPDIHTTLEPAFKALGIAFDQATQIDPRRRGIPSTKGMID